MGDNEAIVIKGAEKFSKYKGYGFQLQYGGNFDDDNVDENGNNKNQTVAMDAFSKNELKKVTTGDWVKFYLSLKMK
jgi:hypothetical protein